MFRRRPFRRPPLFRRRPPRPSVPPRARQALAHANRLMANEQFAEAAVIFERLSEEARRRGMLVRAANLALQASRAHFAADDVQTALERAKEGLRLLVRGGRVGRALRALSRIVETLREKGYDAEAEQLEQEAAQALEKMGLSLDEARQRVPQVTEKRGDLPACCNGCGASLVPDEVEWHDTHTAECLYCGTIVKAV